MYLVALNACNTMARSNLQIITDALRLAGVIHEIQTPSNEDAQDALRRLNDLLLGWKRRNGIDLGFYPQTSLAANIPIDDEYFETVTLQLAQRVGEHWGTGLTDAVVSRSNSLWRSLLAEFNTPEPASLRHVPGRRYSYDIDSDSY